MPRLRFLRPSTGLGLEKRGIHPQIWPFIGRFYYLRLFAWLLLALISASLNQELYQRQEMTAPLPWRIFRAAFLMAPIAASAALHFRQSPFRTAETSVMCCRYVTFAIFHFPVAGFAPGIRKDRAEH